MTELDHKTFDLGAVIAGINFPEEVVTVHFDESLGYNINKAEVALRAAEIRGDAELVASIDTQLSDLREQAKNSTYKVTLRGLPESDRKACNKKARDKFEVEYSFLGQPTPNPDRDDYYNALLWVKSITRFEDPSGASSVPSEENVLAIRAGAGRTLISRIAAGITELVEGAKAGFESAAQDVDFLSDASPEG